MKVYIQLKHWNASKHIDELRKYTDEADLAGQISEIIFR